MYFRVYLGYCSDASNNYDYATECENGRKKHMPWRMRVQRQRDASEWMEKNEWKIK